MFQADFWKKILFASQGVFWPQTPHFGWKMAFWAYIFETAHQILMIFSQMLDIIAFNDLALVLCTKKFYIKGIKFRGHKFSRVFIREIADKFAKSRENSCPRNTQKRLIRKNSRKLIPVKILSCQFLKVDLSNIAE